MSAPDPNDAETLATLRSQAAGVGLVVAIVTGVFTDAEARALIERTVFKATRGHWRESFARHLLNYILHVEFEHTPRLIAEVMQRDRSTITHSIETIEDRRDDPALDVAVTRLARLAEELIALREAFATGVNAKP